MCGDQSEDDYGNDKFRKVNMKTISIIGTGNVASHLYKAFSKNTQNGIDVRIINSRSLEGLPPISDLILISVKDDVIHETAQNLKGRGKVIAHTSGSVDMNVLKGCSDHIGVFYPLQTFSKGKELNYSEIPFFIEGNDPETIKLLEEYARCISDHVKPADSETRKILHIAAVFSCNFSNHLVTIADKLLREKGMDYKILLPLLKETVRKLEELPPDEAQTGPAVRKDLKILSSHEQMLSCQPDLAKIYRQLSDSIMNT